MKALMARSAIRNEDVEALFSHVHPISWALFTIVGERGKGRNSGSRE